MTAIKFQLILKRPGEGMSNWPHPPGFSNLKIETLKQWEWNFQYLLSHNEHIFWRWLDNVINYNVCEIDDEN